MQVNLSNDMSFTSETALPPLQPDTVAANFGAMFAAALPQNGKAAPAGLPQPQGASSVLPPQTSRVLSRISPTEVTEPAPDPLTETALEPLLTDLPQAPLNPSEMEQIDDLAVAEIMPATTDEPPSDLTETQDDTTPLATATDVLPAHPDDALNVPLTATGAPQPDPTEATESTPHGPALPAAATLKSGDPAAPAGLSEQTAPASLATVATPPTTDATVNATTIPTAPPTPAQNLATPDAPPIDMLASGWTERLVQHASTMAAQLRQTDRSETLILTLTPERLGQLQIRLDVIDGVTHVYVIAETSETTRLMQDAQPRLNDLMARAGLEMAGGSGTTDQGNGGRGNAGSDQTTRQPDLSAPSDATPLSDNLSEPAAITGARAKIDLLA